jgi:hypothetical protein
VQEFLYFCLLIASLWSLCRRAKKTVSVYVQKCWLFIYLAFARFILLVYMYFIVFFVLAHCMFIFIVSVFLQFCIFHFLFLISETICFKYMYAQCVFLIFFFSIRLLKDNPDIATETMLQMLNSMLPAQRSEVARLLSTIDSNDNPILPVTEAGASASSHLVSSVVSHIGSPTVSLHVSPAIPIPSSPITSHRSSPHPCTSPSHHASPSASNTSAGSFNSG